MGQGSTSNMQFPTEMWQNANRSANDMYLQGKKALAEGVMSAAGGISGYFKQQKQVKAGNDAAIKFMESPQGQDLLKFTPEQAKNAKEAFSHMGTEETSQYLRLLFQQAGSVQGQEWKREEYASLERRPFLNEAARVLGEGGVGGGPNPKVTPSPSVVPSVGYTPPVARPTSTQPQSAQPKSRYRWKVLDDSQP